MGLQPGKRDATGQCERGQKLQMEDGAARRSKRGVLISG